MSTVTLADLVATSAAIRSTPGRLEKRVHLRRLFQRLDSDELPLAASYLSGEIPQGRVRVGWRALADALRARDYGDDLPLFAAVQPLSKPHSSPTLHELDRAFAELLAVTGPGSGQRRRRTLRELLEPLDKAQRDFIQGLLLRELRQGAQRASVLEALAGHFDVQADALRRAVMFAGALGEVVVAVGGAANTDAACGARSEVLAAFGPRHGVPIEPMLATSAEQAREALQSFAGRAAVEWKLDGVRIQLHRRVDDVHVFSRRLRDVTALAPEAVALARRLDARSFILDGELMGLDAQGRPAPFQDFMSRFSRHAKPVPATNEPGSHAVGEPVEIERVEAWFFDVLECDGRSWVDRPYRSRRAALEQLVPQAACVPQRVVDSADAAQTAFEAARSAGHEGIVIKQLDAPYTAGRRGSAWCKVKPAETLDLVILAAEWGHGRRKGLLSNLHLGARDADDPERFYMLGKTFKGLTDVMLRELTADLLDLATERNEHVVFVQPLRVIEIAFDAVQRSRRYDSEFALRFARVKRFRPDKSAQQANTLEDVRLIFNTRRERSS